jgi:DNA repair exonuclease SbcCD ATPase subunit
MINILSLNPSGFFGYGIHKTIPLNDLGVVLLEGSNGSGKSSLFNALTTILYDDNPLKASGDKVINEIFAKCCGKVEFLDNESTKWRIIYTRKWRKSDKNPDVEYDDPSEILEHGGKYDGTDVYLERWSGSKWMDERASNIAAGIARLDLKSTRKKIISILGMDYQQFVSVGYLAQRQNLKFIEGTHKDRMSVLSELGDIDVWDKRRNRVKDKIGLVTSEIIKSKSIISGIQQANIVLNEPDVDIKNSLLIKIEQYKSLIADCDTKILSNQDISIKWNTSVLDINNSILQLKQQYRDLVAQRRLIEVQLGIVFKQYSDECNKIRNTPKPTQQTELNYTYTTYRGHVSTRKYDLEQMLPGSGKCPRCKTYVDDVHLNRQRELILLDIKETEEKINILKIEIDNLNSAHEKDLLVKLNDAEAKYSTAKLNIENAIGTIDALLVDNNNKSEQLVTTRLNLGPNPATSIDVLAEHRMSYLTNISDCNDQISRWNIQYNQWQQYKSIIAETQIKLSSLEEESKYLNVLERMFSDKGIKAYKMSALVTQLNQSIHKFLHILTNDTIKAWITPFREKNNGEITADMQIMVSDTEKSNVPFELYSGGEKSQIILAFIGAFWSVASTQGSGTNILLLDEVFSNLDTDNREAACRLVEYMKTNGKSSIIIITHDPEIREHLDYSHNWHTIKKSGQSTLSID